MASKRFAALAALALVSTPCAAFEGLTPQAPGVMFYFSLPLDARSIKKEGPALGLSVRGTKEYQVVNLDSRMFSSFSPLGGLEVKWIIAGVVATGAVVAVASKDKSTSNSYQQQQAQQQAAQQQAAQQQAAQQQAEQQKQEPCPVTPTCP